MARRVLRILLTLFLVALVGVTGWQVWTLDRTRAQQRDAAALLQRDAQRVTQAILDLRASQRAYLSPGQGIDTWKARVDKHLETLREHFHALREQASASTSPVAAAAAQADDEAIEALVAMKFLEQRIADHVTAGRIQHAADLVYADGVRISLTLERAANAAFVAHEQDLQAGRTRVQWTEGALLGLAAAIGFMLAWLVMPSSRRTQTSNAEAAEAATDDAAAGAKSDAAGKAGRRPEPATGLGLSERRGATTAGATTSSGSAAAAVAAAGRGAAPAGGGITGGATKSGGATGMPVAAPATRRGSTATPAGGGGGRIAPTTAAAAANVLDDLPLHAPAATYASAGGHGASSERRNTSAGHDGSAGAGASTGTGPHQGPSTPTGTARTGTGAPGTVAASSGTGGSTATTTAAVAVAPPAGSAGTESGISGMAVHTQDGLLAAAAELTVAVARVGDVDGLRPVLARLAEYLDAVGVIVWLEDASSQRLTPIVTHGYTAETLAHLPPIDLDADNATARAWRLNELQIVPSRNGQPGAIVVPMPSSAGCVGVISAEVRRGREHDPATLALARILAAQLAMLTGARG